MTAKKRLLTCFGSVAALLGLITSSALLAQNPQPASTAPVVIAPLHPSTLPASAYASLPFIEMPKLSPDGTRLVGLFAIGGQQRIAIMNLFNKAEPLVQIHIMESTEVSSIRWVNDENVLVGLHSLLTLEGGDRWYVSRAIGINRLTGAVTKLLWDSKGQNAADVLWVAADGSSDVIIAAQDSIYTNDLGFWPSVYRIDIATGKKRRLMQGREGIMDWGVDSTGHIRMGTRYIDASRNSFLFYRNEEDAGALKIVDRSNSRKREEVISPFLFLPGTDRALSLHDNDKGRSAIYEVDMLTSADVRQVYEAPEGSEIQAVSQSADGKELLGAYTSGSKGQVHWFDPSLAELQTQFGKAVGDRQAQIISFSRDRSKMLVEVTRADTPGALYYYNDADGKLRQIAIKNKAIGTRSLSPVKYIQYKARDGLEIEAVLTLPKGENPKNLPIIMLPHGGPWGRDGLDYDYWAQFIASRGYAVLQPNFRGSTGYGTDFMRKGEGQMGLAMQDDISDGLRWAVDQGIADPKRACILGASYGGYAAMWGIIKDPAQYRCAVSISGVSNLRREVNDFGNALMAGKFRDDWQRMTPDFAAVSPINGIGNIAAPLLLIHGKKDITVDHVQSVTMHKRMQDAGKDVEFLSLPDADHYFTRQEDREALLIRIESFLAKHNPAR